MSSHKFIKISIFIIIVTWLASCGTDNFTTNTDCRVTDITELKVEETDAARREYYDWPRFRGANADGISSETRWNPLAISPQPKVIWRKKIGNGYSSVVIKGAYLYTMGFEKSKDVVYCLAMDTGEEVWSYSYKGKRRFYLGPRATPTLDGDYIYTLGCNGKLYCLDNRDGTLIWSIDLMKDFQAKLPDFGFSASPVVEGDMLIINANLFGIVLNKKNGELIWNSTAAKGGYATPVIFIYRDRTCIAMFGYGGLYVVDLETGKNLWFYKWVTTQGVNVADPIVWDHKIFISSSYGVGSTLLKITENGLVQLWYQQRMRNQVCTCVLIDGYIYGNDGFTNDYWGVYRCLDAKTGEVMWSRDYNFGTITAANDMLILLTESGKLFIARATPDSYQEIASAVIFKGNFRCFTTPVLCRGYLFCRTDRGQLVCLDLSR